MVGCEKGRLIPWLWPGSHIFTSHRALQIRWPTLSAGVRVSIPPPPALSPQALCDVARRF